MALVTYGISHVVKSLPNIECNAFVPCPCCPGEGGGEKQHLFGVGELIKPLVHDSNGSERLGVTCRRQGGERFLPINELAPDIVCEDVEGRLERREVEGGGVLGLFSFILFWVFCFI